MTWEREPASIGLERTRADIERRAAFVDSWAATGTLGHIREICAVCQADWPAGGPQCPECGSNAFSQVPVEATPVELGPGRRLRNWLAPAKPAAPSPDPRDVAALAALADAARAFAVALDAADGAARRIVQAGCEGYGKTQDVLNTVSAVGGDSSIDRLNHSLLPEVEALVSLLENPR